MAKVEPPSVAPAGFVAALAAVGDCGDLGVKASELGMPSLADHLPAASEDGSDRWIRADPPAPVAGQLERPAEMGSVLVRGQRRHPTAPD